MLTSLSVKNFGLLRDVTLDLEPFTVLVGPNDCGKSTILRALQALSLGVSAAHGWAEAVPTPRDHVDFTFERRGGDVRFEVIMKEAEATWRYAVSVASPLHVVDEQFEGPLGGFSSTKNPGDVKVRDDGTVRAPYGPQNQLVFRPRLASQNASGPKEVAGYHTTALAIAQSLADCRRYALRPERLLQTEAPHGVHERAAAARAIVPGRRLRGLTSREHRRAPHHRGANADNDAALRKRHHREEEDRASEPGRV